MRPSTLVVAVTLCLVVLGEALAGEQPAPDLAAGNAAYEQSCARCHGATGAGDGVDAKRFYPRPRDLTMGVYKFRSTASGTPPTDDDLFQTIANGLPGSNMPDWRHLDEATRWQLVYYLKSLSSFFTETAPEPVAVSPDPGRARADLTKGRHLYEQLACTKCHGVSGRADGPSAATLVDDWGMPIRPADFTQGWTYRGGADVRSVMLRIRAGIDGSGMPSFADSVSPEETWHLAYYVTSLQEAPSWNMVAHPTYVSGPLPTNVDDPRWASTEGTDVRLRNVVSPAGDWAAPPTVRAVAFQGMFNDEALALRIWWDDPTQDTAQPSARPGDGDGRAGDALSVVMKPLGGSGDVVTLQAWPSRNAPALDLWFWSADHPNEGREAIADNYQPVMGNGWEIRGRTAQATYSDGRWTLLLRRPLVPTDVDRAAAFAVDEFTAIAIAVWDGGNSEARAVSPWVDVVLRKPSTTATGHRSGSKTVWMVGAIAAGILMAWLVLRPWLSKVNKEEHR